MLSSIKGSETLDETTEKIFFFILASNFPITVNFDGAENVISTFNFAESSASRWKRQWSQSHVVFVKRRIFPTEKYGAVVRANRAIEYQ